LIVAAGSSSVRDGGFSKGGGRLRRHCKHNTFGSDNSAIFVFGVDLVVHNGVVQVCSTIVPSYCVLRGLACTPGSLSGGERTVLLLLWKA